MTKCESQQGFCSKWLRSFAVVFFTCLTLAFCTRQTNDISTEDQKLIEHFNEALNNNLDIKFPDSTLRMALDVLAISTRVEDETVVFNALSLSGASYNNSGYPDSALYYSEKMQALATETGNQKYLARSHNIMAMAYLKKQNYNEAKLNLQRAIHINKNIGETSDISSYFQSLGNVYGEMGQFDSAIYYYQVAAQDFVKDTDRKGLAMVYGNIGSIHIKLRNHEEALNYYRKATSINRQINNYASLAHNYSNMGAIFNELGKNDLAKTYYDSAIRINKITGNQFMTVVTSFNYANVLQEEGEYEEALTTYFEILEQSKSLKMAMGIYKSKTSIGETFLKTGEFRKAKQYLEEALLLSREKNISDGQANLLLNITQAMINLNNPKGASQALLRYKNTLDSLNKQNQQKTVADLEARYQLKEKDSEIKYMNRVNKSRTRLNYALAAVIVLVGVLFAFIILLYRTNIKNLGLKNERIEKDNALKQLKLEKADVHAKLKAEEAEKMELSLKLKEEITGMIVHDLKNPLNAIINIPDDLPENQNKKLRQSGKQMLTQVMNILDVYKFEATKIPIKKSPAQLKEISNLAIDEIEYLKDEKNIQINNLISDEVFVNAENKLMVRVFVNLLSNALKYSPTHDEIEIRVTKNTADDKSVRVEVKDHGPGIPLAYHQKVFEKSGHSKGNTLGSSSGLGLTFCKMAVEAHGGEIAIDKNYTGGTCICFTLPLLSAIPLDKNESKPIPQIIELSANEKLLLQDYLPQLKNLEIYEVTALRKLIREIEIKHQINKDWLDKLKNAVNFENEKLYKQLIDQIR